MPEPLLPVAVVARSRAAEDALAKNLGRLVAADPTLRLERNVETHQQVLWCTGEAHADLVLERLRASGAEVDTEPVRVALRETFTTTATGHGRHVKQSGGHGQYAICDVRVEPLPRGAGYQFDSEVVGGAVPTHYLPSVDKGVRAQMEKGLLAGYPVVDIRVVVFDGKAHSVDSSDAAFQTAGALALKAAAASGQLTLLEPVDEVRVRVPDSYVGAVLSDLSGRRGRVLGTEPDPAHHGHTLIRAEVPQRELLHYLVALRAITSGAGTFTRSLSDTKQCRPRWSRRSSRSMRWQPERSVRPAAGRRIPAHRPGPPPPSPARTAPLQRRGEQHLSPAAVFLLRLRGRSWPVAVVQSRWNTALAISSAAAPRSRPTGL